MSSKKEPHRYVFPAGKLVFCAENGCGCHYLDGCPKHGTKSKSEPPERPERTTWPAGIYTTRKHP